MKTLLLPLSFALGLFAQNPRGEYTHQYTTTGSSQAVTLHLPSTSTSRSARMVGASIYCASACTATLARDGTAPTITSATATKLNSTAATASVVPYNASNVGAGTTLKSYTLSAGQELSVELTNKGILPGENLTITVSLSGAVVFFQWREF